MRSEIMNNTSFSAGAMLLAGVLVAGSATVTLAASQDYEFQPVSTDVKQGQGSLVSIRLVDKRTGKPVADAVIFTTRMDMAPEGMEMMTTPVEAATSTEPGVYAFKTDFTMAGGWRFKLAAKVQGEPDTVQGELVLKAAP
ncbi:FixH family protein [Rhizobium rhizogenes]|nr:FixH family protein [Rhizobium rhizogenes]